MGCMAMSGKGAKNYKGVLKFYTGIKQQSTNAVADFPLGGHQPCILPNFVRTMIIQLRV